MSEYQHFEWLAIDRPLTANEQAAVNRLSSHIDVMPHGAIVEYHWGDFKHDPNEVLFKYFDAFIYYANWGSQTLGFRLPQALVDEKAVQVYLWDDCVELRRRGANYVLTIFNNSEDGDWDYEVPAATTLVALRDAILNGDYRVLYLAWLSAAQNNGVEEDIEPPVPPGLAELSEPLVEFCQFFQLDLSMVQAAAETSAPMPQDAPLEFDAAIARLSREECESFLLRLANNEASLARTFNRRLRDVMGAKPIEPTASDRTWGEIQARAEQLAAQAKKRQQAQAEAERVEKLQTMAPKADQYWAEVHQLLQNKTASAYDKATQLLVDLHDLAVYQNKLPAFQGRIRALAAQYSRRVSFLDRLRTKKLIT